MLKGRDLLSIHELTVGEVEEILALAAELKAKQKAGIPVDDTDVDLQRFEVVRHTRGGRPRK